MGRTYTNDDNPLRDFALGKLTGVSYNCYSSFGAQYHQPPSPYRPPEPVGRNPRNDEVIVPQPIRSLTPEERAEQARRSANREIIVKKSPFFQRLSGKVLSYLDADGKLVVNADGDLVEGEVIPRREHLARVEKAYRRIWQAGLPLRYTAPQDTCERMAELERGYFISPVNRWGLKLTIGRFRTKWTIFGKKTVKRRLWAVGVKEYDRRLRIFIENAYLGTAYARVQFGGKRLTDLPAQEVFEYFIEWPRTY